MVPDKNKKNVKMLLTFPEEVRHELRVRAAIDEVSMNAWLVTRLQEYFKSNPVEIHVGPKV